MRRFSHSLIMVALVSAALPAVAQESDCGEVALAVWALKHDLYLREVERDQERARMEVEGEDPDETIERVLRWLAILRDRLSLEVASGSVRFTPGIRSSAQLELELVRREEEALPPGARELPP